MLKRVLVSTMILLVMYLVVFLAFWMIMPLNSSGDLIAILMLLSVSLVCALVVAAGGLLLHLGGCRYSSFPWGFFVLFWGSSCLSSNQKA